MTRCDHFLLFFASSCGRNGCRNVRVLAFSYNG